MSSRAVFRIYKIPLILAFLSLAGLIAALLYDGFEDWLSCAALCVPLVVLGVCLVRPKRKLQ